MSFSPVCVVDKRIEALVEPLPENNGRCGFVESHHATRYQHVERNLLKIISSVKTLLSTIIQDKVNVKGTWADIRPGRIIKSPGHQNILQETYI